ncbi:hypothetical protein IMSAGC012_02698 [Lachnospiraceae bacterium]|nr:hypothetical protein IMSAGC012_02698 [Lachnospiraceae bacterium]
MEHVFMDIIERRVPMWFFWIKMIKFQKNTL